MSKAKCALSAVLVGAVVFALITGQPLLALTVTIETRRTAKRRQEEEEGMEDGC